MSSLTISAYSSLVQGRVRDELVHSPFDLMTSEGEGSRGMMRVWIPCVALTSAKQRAAVVLCSATER